MELIAGNILELINKLDSLPFKIWVIEPNVAIANLKHLNRYIYHTFN